MYRKEDIFPGKVLPDQENVLEMLLSHWRFDQSVARSIIIIASPYALGSVMMMDEILCRVVKSTVSSNRAVISPQRVERCCKTMASVYGQMTPISKMPFPAHTLVNVPAGFNPFVMLEAGIVALPTLAIAYCHRNQLFKNSTVVGKTQSAAAA